MNVCQTERSRYALSEGECEWSTHINSPQHFSVCCPVYVYSDPASRHVLVSPHPHARDHSSNAFALAKGCAEKKARSHATCSTDFQTKLSHVKNQCFGPSRGTFSLWALFPFSLSSSLFFSHFLLLSSFFIFSFLIFSFFSSSQGTIG